MTIEVVWDDEDCTILRLDLDGSWTWHEYDHAIDAAYGLIRAVANPVDIMLNLSNSDPLPPMKSLKPFQRTLSAKPANVRTFIAVSGDTFACGMCVSFLKALLATTPGQARAILAETEASRAAEPSATA